MTPEDRHDCQSDAAAFVLGALEPDELERFQEHLKQCVVCRDEVEALQGVVHALAVAAPQHTAPKSLRRRVVRSIRQEPRAAQDAASTGRVRRPSYRIALVSATSALVAAAVALAIVLVPGSGGPRVVQARVAAPTGKAALQITGDRAELVVRDLPSPPPGEVYEVWLKAPHQAPSPANVLFKVTSGGSANLSLPDSLRGISEVLVTREPDGGTLVPTHKPLIVAQLT